MRWRLDPYHVRSRTDRVCIPGRRKESKREKIKNNRIKNICIHLFPVVKYSYRSLISVSGLRGSTIIEGLRVSRRKIKRYFVDRSHSTVFALFLFFFFSLSPPKREVKREKEGKGKITNRAKINLNVDNPVFSFPPGLNFHSNFILPDYNSPSFFFLSPHSSSLFSPSLTLRSFLPFSRFPLL